MPIILCVILFFLSAFSPLALAEPPVNIYAYTNAGMFSPTVKTALFRVYVPNSKDGTVSVIDPATYQVIETFPTGKNPQHVVPSYDLQTLWVLNNRDNSITPINPTTGKPGTKLNVADPYNLYYTPDGQFAIVVCEGRKELQFRDPKTMALRAAVPTKCGGANHMEFTADGRYAIVTCEFSGQLMKVDLVNRQVVGYLSLLSDNDKKMLSLNTAKSSPLDIVIGDITISPDGHVSIDGHASIATKTKMNSESKSMPQDIRSSPDGRVFFVADMMKNGVILIDPISFTKIGFIPTGIGTHAIYPSRDGKLFYVSNRGCYLRRCGPHGQGSISVIDPFQRKAIANWPIPNGGSPDMGNVSADGKELWLSGRYDNEVYVFDTATGNLTHRIAVGKGPHGLAVWPQPGRYSLGHTGNMR